MKIDMLGISKSFGNNHVLRDVNFHLDNAEVHALMGENGAGKSTLMNILTGLLNADSGQILVDDKEVHFNGPKDAEEHGISFIHQEMNNFGEMTVLENMFLNKEVKNKWGMIDEKTMRAEALKIFQTLNINYDLNAMIGDLSIGAQQMIEISKAMMSEAKVIIMDEPTAALTNSEITSLFTTVNHLKDQGVSFIYISHRIEENMEIADKITIMRDGHTVDESLISETSVEKIVTNMVGRDIGDFYPERHANTGKTILSVTHLESDDKFHDINFTVKEGEILGFSGLMGSGRTEIMRAIFGVDHRNGGDVAINGKKVKIMSLSDAINQGIGFVTENRKDEGLILDFSVSENIIMASLKDLVKKHFIDEKVKDDFVNLLVKRLTIKTDGTNIDAGSLSGGNQQKVVLAKWIGAGSKILILDEPTRGVDVGAKREIYDLINELTSRGVAIIMVSSDLPEVLAMSDRIAVMYEGNMMAIVDNSHHVTESDIMTLATGGKTND
ncbi:sugar ABC transporter ATP-binding protein [Leuconostoc falkenbergense]|uniref:Sugar ABC transporter ATP-binding protein n=1 Tax=Leuconostoc falkenbergense TaxID=2766470 RepID=A0ABT7RWM4_9LACO|nr:sugar ABC transporter ATP-binding protein [Leuconostoc falkenbergense]MDM7645629.1 sugar ABC transporter ATP-binding protein [Leuconostoc falkenbergense]